MKNRVVLSAALALVISVSTLPLGGCSGEMSFTTAKLSEATMCLGVDADSMPVNPTDTFGSTTPEIFCSVKLSNAPEDTEILSEWVYVKGALAGVTDYVIDSVPVTTDGTRYLVFSLAIPTDGWPVGEYQLNLYIDGKESLSVPFTVIVGASLSEATIALGVDSLMRPLNATSTIPPTTPEVFCSVLVSDAPEGTEVGCEWYYVGGELEGISNMLIDTFTMPVDGTQYVEFSLPIAADAWPAGEYVVNLYVDGILEGQVPFTVAQAAVTATMAVNIDANNQPINPTTQFQSGVEKIWTVVFVNDEPAGTKLKIEWYETGGTVDTYINKYEQDVETRETPYAVYLTRGTGGWPKGDYACVISINGERQIVLPFTVT